MIKAFWKLSTRDKLVLLIAGALCLSVVVYLSISLFTGGLFSGVKFPESTLVREENDLQKKQVKSFPALPVEINIPGTGLGVSLVGDELPPSEHGAAFLDDSVYTFAGKLEKGDTVASFLSLYLSGVIGESGVAGSYSEKVYGQGFLNATYMEYYGGTVQTVNNTYYCLVYRYFGEERDIVFGTARTSETASTFKLKFDKALIDKMLYTVVETGEVISSLQPLTEVDPSTIPDVPVNEPEKESSPSGAEKTGGIGEETGNDYGFGEVADREPLPGEKAAEALRKRKEKEFALAYPGQEVFKVKADVPADLDGHDVGIELFFTEAYAKIPYAIIRNTATGRVVSAEYLNETYTGDVVFYISNCESGEWIIEADRAQSLGSYTVTVVEAEALRKLLNYDYEPVPRE